MHVLKEPRRHHGNIFRHEEAFVLGQALEHGGSEVYGLYFMVGRKIFHLSSIDSFSFFSTLPAFAKATTGRQRFNFQLSTFNFSTLSAFAKGYGRQATLQR
jgi:hypothetical protein